MHEDAEARAVLERLQYDPQRQTWLCDRDSQEHIAALVSERDRLAAEVNRLKDAVLNEARRADTALMTLARYARELGMGRLMINPGAHVEVRRWDGTAFLGTVMPPPVGREAAPGEAYVQPDSRGESLRAWPVEVLTEMVP